MLIATGSRFAFGLAQTSWLRFVPESVKVGVPQAANRKAPMRVLHWPPAGSYMPVNQKVQPSAGSTPI